MASIFGATQGWQVINELVSYNINMLNPNRVGSSEGRSTKGVLYILLIVAVIAGAAYGVYTHQQQKIKELTKQTAATKSLLDNQKKKYNQLNATYSYTSKRGLEIKVFHPLSNQKVPSPVVIIGEVPGNWSFEASFPVQLVDKKGNIIAQATAQLLGNWQTDQLVPFSAKLEFKQAGSGTGSIILKKDNPSGLLGNDDSVVVPITY